MANKNLTKKQTKLWRDLHKLIQNHDFQGHLTACPVRQANARKTGEAIYFKIEQIEAAGMYAEPYYLAFKEPKKYIDKILHSPLNGWTKGWWIEK